MNQPSGNDPAPVVGVVMGSRSDWDTMRHACETLERLGVAYEARVMSAHRTPRRVRDYTESARDRGLKVIIAGAGGAAHLAGAMAALTPLPVLGVPVESKSLKGLDSLLSIVQMPGGVPVATLGIGKPGAINAALLAAEVLALADADTAAALDRWRADQAAAVPELPFDPE
jgi:5-(carboxyamino)imidazole ribonucleotide mutase